MTTDIIATALVSFALGMTALAVIRDQRVRVLRSLVNAAEQETRAVRAAGRVAAAASLRHAVAAEKAERRANDAEFATTLALIELDRVDPRPGLVSMVGGA